MPVPPEAPDVVQATCINGEVTVPNGDAEGHRGRHLHVDPPGPYDPGTDDYTVTVTATLSDGLEWGRCRRGGRESTT